MTKPRPARPVHHQSTTRTSQDRKTRSPARPRSPLSDNQTDYAETPAGTGRSEELLLRPASPPVDQLDFDDRHDTRATQSTAMLKRYAALRRDRRKDEWHRLIMGLVILIASMAFYLASFIAVSGLLPHLTAWEVAQYVGLAYFAGCGGVAARSAGRALEQRHDRRSSPSST